MTDVLKQGKIGKYAFRARGSVFTIEQIEEVPIKDILDPKQEIWRDFTHSRTETFDQFMVDRRTQRSAIKNLFDRGFIFEHHPLREAVLQAVCEEEKYQDSKFTPYRGEHTSPINVSKTENKTLPIGVDVLPGMLEQSLQQLNEEGYTVERIFLNPDLIDSRNGKPYWFVEAIRR